MFVEGIEGKTSISRVKNCVRLHGLRICHLFEEGGDVVGIISKH